MCFPEGQYYSTADSRYFTILSDSFCNPYVPHTKILFGEDKACHRYF